LSEIIVENLLEQRDFYLNTLKHLNFLSIMNSSKNELEEIEKLQTNTIDQLRNVEQELGSILSKNPH
jgi:hypothetical protein